MNQHRPDTASPFGEDLWEVLARYVAGESPSAEAAAVRQWLAAEPRRQELVTTLGQAVNSLIVPGAPVDVEAALRKVSARLREESSQSRAKSPGSAIGVRSDGAPIVRELRPRTWRTMGLRAAAAVVLLAGAALVWRTASAPQGPSVAAERTFTTPVGQTDSIRLNDGSLAVLGPASTLIVAAGYGNESRSLELTGVALFDVVHDTQRPFLVRAGGTTIEDLGTTFSVRSDARGEVSVIVTKGSVRVNAPIPASEAQPKEGIVLKAGDRAEVRDGQQVVERATATDHDLAWTRGRLVFDDAPIARVRADIRRWYGVELELTDSALARRHLTASFSGEPVDQVLKVIGLALGAQIERRGDTAVVRPR